MNFIWLEDFLALAATGNFTRAATERHSSQPAFSRRIRALEEWVGEDLIDRSTYPANLTEVGEWFRGIAQELLLRVSRVPEDAKQVAEASSVTLRLASTHALSFTFLPRWLRSLEASATLGPIQLISDVLQNCEILMQEGKVQFVISHSHPAAKGPLDSDSYCSIVVGYDLLLPVTCKGNDGGPRYFLSDASITSVPLLEYTKESGLGRIISSVLNSQKRESGLQAVFTAHLASVLRTMVIDGRGIAWLPKTLIEDDLQQGLLVAAGGQEWNIPVSVSLYRDLKLTGKAAENFWDHAVESKISI